MHNEGCPHTSFVVGMNKLFFNVWLIDKSQDEMELKNLNAFFVLPPHICTLIKVLTHDIWKIPIKSTV